MDLSGKGFSPAHSFLQNASSLVSAYGLGSSMVAGQTPLTTSMFAGTSHGLTSPVYSGSLSTSLSPSHTSFSNGHHISLHRHSEKQDGSAKSQIYASPAPVFNRHKDSFPYGISGVPMPNYNYHGDVYQFTSNGYPRKSRTCSYCGKVFTRSTTRRYHEKRCPLLRAAVSSYMGDENSGTSTAAASTQSRGRSAELTTHSFKGPGQSLGSSMSGINRSSEPQELATSMLAKSPAGERRASGDSYLSGYQTSVIVKQEPHELEALANMASGASASSLNKKHIVQSQELSDSMLRFSPGSEDSDYRIDTSANVSPGYEPGLDLTVSKSPSHTSGGGENVHKSSDDYIRGQYGNNKTEDRTEMRQDRGVIPPHLAPLRFNSDSRKDSQEENEMDVVDDNAGGNNEMFDSNGELLKRRRSIIDAEGGETESVTSDKRDGKSYSSHKCGICGKTFENAGKLHLHEQLHTKFKPYACKFCGQKFAKAAQRIEHEKTHNGMEVTHICAVCGSSFTRKYSLKLHMRRWHQEGPWLCRHCGKASLTQMELKTHLYSHNLPKLERESLLYMPDIPHNYSATSTNVEEADGKDYSMKQVSENDGASGPEVGLQSMQEMEMCQECGRDFPKGYLRYHLKSHEAQKPYSCPICAKRFGYKNNMKSHIKLHTGIKPFQCKICGAKFTRGSTLRRHARRHGIIADSVWDLFVKPNYSKSGENQSRNNKLDTLPTSRMDLNVSTGNQSSTGSGAGDSGEPNYLVTTLSSTPTHGSLYPLYASLGQMPPHLSLYSGLSVSTSYLAPQLPHSSIYAASSQRHPQQLDALNLSLNKASNDLQSDQSSFSNVSAERSRSRSRSLSGSESHRYIQGDNVKMEVKDVAIQVNTCCVPVPNHKQVKSDESIGTPAKTENLATGSSTSPTPQLPNTPSPLAVVPYIVTSPSQRPSNIDSTSPALSVSSAKDYSMETISSLIGSGRMFKCFHCECYFAEYAMYRIHSKMHISDTTHPFVCMVCGEDCHDRVYFALHLAEHLR
ncbi:zinc finger protein 236-like [Mercenaria mercenaria]|uniref:zinc finger protein 236-like n=1 Tax=Mercenaria mercenaria TaxID=6596 RepID=UPI00234ED0AC|nr:zinc finger protein 236-like [Mercenaria mercenaria]XP_053382964.1 zinc finger protein 236-like [Mercenaria mercenaria]XP_053382965.1 zinc finger protein 236-like [Mercenaria mercenaria]XP_053382966.1 zinc finger protein 236-like [Mercenaria mercenaria]XP_053382967.1 zinc finger protein 236-like [Mercenaria mercenaria]XP_053382968.1 zinc finger protein 236-like [Mercenaria mercenaria]